MSDENPTLQDIWRLLGSMNKRVEARFDVLEREIVQLKAFVGGAISALKESIEARDFRLDDHGRRLTDLEQRADRPSTT